MERELKMMLVQVLRNQITDNKSILEMHLKPDRRKEHELRLAQTEALLHFVDPEEG
jgi:hypothetical protein